MPEGEDMKNKQRFKALTYAILSLQFTRDKDGTPEFVITSNMEDEARDSVNIFTGVDELMFARNLVRASNCTARELAFLCKFFRHVEKEMELMLPAKEAVK